MATEAPLYLFAGLLQRLYQLLPSGKTRLDVPGGNLLYAAAGAGVWDPEERFGLVARVGEDYPQEWLRRFEQHNCDVTGVRVLPEAVDLRSFAAYSDMQTRHSDDPVPHFARLGMTLPKALLGYKNPLPRLDSRTAMQPTSIRQSDIPGRYLECKAAHLCPVDYLSHSLLPAVFRQGELPTVTVDPSPGYMNPDYWEHVPALLTGLTAFLPSEEELRSLFRGRSDDLWEMAEALAAYGCELIVIKRGLRGQYLYDSASKKRWEIPAYPSREIDPTGVGDAFCGGFLAGYLHSYDPLHAALCGNISASLAIEGSDPFYAMGALPGLAQARLEALRVNVVRY